ncbi:MAG TPA: hypothetical protein VGM18_09195 [Candidatus Sulfotelmatobacter sp.]|jgi:hypothetical protein
MLEFKKQLLRSFCCVALLAAVGAQSSQPLPRIKGQSLAGHQVVLPDACAGKVAILIFGFTKASKNQTSAWAAAISKDTAVSHAVELYQLPVLEDVPRLIRGMVISSMKNGVPENARDHFVPLVQSEAELKKLVNYNEHDAAYLIVLDRQGQIIRQMHGAVNEARIAELRTVIGSLVSQSN